MKYCVASHHVCSQIWNKISDYSRFEINADETGISKEFLYLLASSMASVAVIKEHCIPEESVSGADFEIFIRRRFFWISILAQAKVYKRDKRNLRGFKRGFPSNPQWDRLLSSAAANFSFPLYCVYIGDERIAGKAPLVLNSSHGVSFFDANDIKKLGQDSISVNKLFKRRYVRFVDFFCARGLPDPMMVLKKFPLSNHAQSMEGAVLHTQQRVQAILAGNDVMPQAGTSIIIDLANE